MVNRKYKSGDVVGPYTVIEYVDGGKITCKCNVCNSIVDVFTSNIRRQRMCRYCRTKYNSKPKADLTGKRFGRLTVIRSVNKDNGRIAWECLCDCGASVVVSTDHLNDGHTQSCGCYMRDRTSQSNTNDLTGQRFGLLSVLKRTDGHKVPSGQVLSSYLCRCDCGAELEVLSMNLVSGNTKSCGCIGNSVGEYKVQQILLEKGIKFSKQYSFSDLRSDSGGGLLRFDFAVLNSDDSVCCLIEFNGEQHYYAEERSTEFGKQQREETDKLKRIYCQENKINLYVIRYDENIEEKVNEIIDGLTIE